ncbi:hypothetical protein HDV03_001788 [Kappamyces sp. JEL0829]|nr:hypothetical protein HDV03_001788 [Kappamyces sp. JEL0829]
MGPQQKTYEQNILDLRRTCDAILKEEFNEKGAGRIEWVPIEWHSKLHSLDIVEDRIKRITLPTCSIIRSICNDTLSDGFYYFGTFHGQNIVNTVAKLLNEEHAKAMKKWPDFTGKVSIVAHSLGSVISYDLLANQHEGITSPYVQPVFPQTQTHTSIKYPKLKFQVHHLFCLGSPLGAVFVQRGQTFESYPLPKETKYYNVFNLYDPIAYRVEPLIDQRYLEISPVLLQRPSQGASRSSFEFSYYKEMIYAYMPDLSLSKLRFIPKIDLPKLDIPSFPDLGITSSFLEASQSLEFSQFLDSFPALSARLQMPSLPDIPILTTAQAAFKNRVSRMLSSVWGTDEEDLKVPTGSKRQRSSGVSGPAKKKREVTGPDNSTHRVDVVVSPQRVTRSVTASSPPQTLPASPRPIKTAVSQISKKKTQAAQEAGTETKEGSPLSTPTSPTQSLVEANQRVFSYISQFFTSQENQPLDETSVAVAAAENQHSAKPTERLHNVNDLGEKLTQELIAAAQQAEKTMEKEKKSWTSDKSFGRYDYFVTEKTIDSMVHQYMLGLSAHFSYWTDKVSALADRQDIMWHIVKEIKDAI